MERWQTHVLEILQDQFARKELKYYEDIKSEELAKRVRQGGTKNQITQYLSSKWIFCSDALNYYLVSVEILGTLENDWWLETLT